MSKLNLTELKLINFYHWPSPLKYFMILFVAILLFVFNYGLYLGEYDNQYKGLIKEEMSLKNEFETKQKLANLQAYKTQLNSVKKIVEGSLKRLVKDNEVTSLVDEVSQAGLSSGLIIDFFAPKTDESKKELYIKMDVVGNYQQLSLFLSKIYNLNKLVTFENFDLTKEEGKTKDYGLLRMKIELKIHRYYE